MTKQPLPRGLIVPMVTPLADQDRLDVGVLELQVERLVSARVQGLFLLGTCGEGPSLGDRLKHEVVERVCRQVAGRTAVLVCATDPSAVEAESLADHAAICGADAVVFAAPYYFPLTQNELADYFDRRALQACLPVVAYNFPGLTKTSIAPETVTRLIDNPRIVGFKDSSGDLAYFEQVRRLSTRRPDWRVYMGPEELLVESVQLGGDGGVCGGANVLPELFVGIYEAAAGGDQSRLPALLARAAALSQIYACGDGPGAPGVRGLKAAMAAIGLGNGMASDPLASADDVQRRRIAKVLCDLGAATPSDVAEPRI